MSLAKVMAKADQQMVKPGEGDGEGGPEDGEPKEGDEPPADEEGGEGEPAEGDVEAGPVEPQDGTDTSNDDAVVAPGETVSMNPNAGPPPAIIG